ncbi:MAG: ATP-binding protein [Desulfobacula sp.]|nr:ATP-binding protein [Desulfobacula sp.]
MVKKKKKLVWQIFPSFLIITALSLSAVANYSAWYFKGFFLENSEKELTIRANLLHENFSRMLRTKPDHFERIDQLCKQVGKQNQTRVTIVLPNGQVVGDSFGNIKVMENHATRPEIAQALEKKRGMSVRYSATLDEKMMYIALPIFRKDQASDADKEKNQVIAVIRTSVSISAIDKKISSVRNNILLTLLVTIVAATMASLYVSRRIVRPIENMKNGAALFAKGKLDTTLVVPDSEELSELAVTMNQMAKNLDQKITEFKNRSMELEAVHSSMQEGVIAVDKDERIITINTAAARILDVSVSELKSKSILEVVGNLELQHFIQRALATNKPVEDDIALTGDQDLILNIHSTALYETGNVHMGTLIIFHDITRIRRLERMHEQFAANVSHELKTPLTTIKGFIETIQGMPADNAIKESERFLNIIEKNVNRMVDLINDLLALSRLERLQGTDIVFEDQNIAVLIQVAVSTCNTKIKEKKMIVDIDCPNNLTAMVDSSLLEQAIINLVDNAVKYSPQGSCIFVKVGQQDGFINIVVADEGPGIGQDHLPKIFNRFYRVDKARSRREGGTGLGLAIVKHIIQYHRGKIDVESIRGRGCAFKISIPV